MNYCWNYFPYRDVIQGCGIYIYCISVPFQVRAWMDCWQRLISALIAMTSSTNSVTHVAIKILTFFIVGVGAGLAITMFVDMKHGFARYGSTSRTKMTSIHFEPTSHAELNLLPRGSDESVTFNDENMHHGKSIDLIHKSQNTPVPYPTMLHSEQKCAHFCSEWSIVGYGTVAFRDLWN